MGKMTEDPIETALVRDRIQEETFRELFKNINDRLIKIEARLTWCEENIKVMK